jgi:hypothetical protein
MAQQSNGGVATTSRLTLYPTTNVTTGFVGFNAFDPSAGFNDFVAGGTYSFKVEEVLPGRTPTINSAIIKYRDLGVANFTLVFSGVDENQNVQTKNVAISIGTGLVTGRLMTKVFGVGFTAKDIQCSIMRAANSGSISIAKLVLAGRVEVAQEF